MAKNYPPNQEFEFNHPSGTFTGFVESKYYSGMIRVRLTSPANCNLRIKEGAYSPGDKRVINSIKCPGKKITKDHVTLPSVRQFKNHGR